MKIHKAIEEGIRAGWPILYTEQYQTWTLDDDALRTSRRRHSEIKKKVNTIISAAAPYLVPDRDQIARAIDPESWKYYDTGMFPPEHPASIGVVRKSREAADRVIALMRIED